MIGGPANLPDAMLIIAADHERSVAEQVRSIREQIEAITIEPSPVRVIYEQEGNTLPGPLRGHEHFGFKDGISQPGVRGRVDSPTHPLLTPRYIDDSDPLGVDFAAPGQPLLWPGEFVLGYPANDQDDPLRTKINDVDPPWSTNGSFLVFRRLRQDVPAFRRFIAAGTKMLTDHGGFGTMSQERFGAMCVGRWASGTPILRAALSDNLRIARAKNEANNSFFYDQDTDPVKWRPEAHRKTDTLPSARRDFDGVVCPLGAHVRKVNPRDETTDDGVPEHTLKRRILRRGIPYGPAFDPQKEESAAVDRGLLFIAYQASIDSQFEFLQQDWANKTNAPRDSGSIDPIIGQNTNAADRKIRFVNGNDESVDVPIQERFVIATGAAYLFVPSISAIRDVLTKI